MISVKEHGLRAFRTHVFLDDVELVSCCVAADPVEGWADCYKKTEDGRFWLWLGEPVIERRYGTIRFEAIE